jgi:hypothetical protein
MPAGLSLNPSMQHFLAKALASGKLITFDAMHPPMAKLRARKMRPWPSLIRSGMQKGIVPLGLACLLFGA